MSLCAMSAITIENELRDMRVSPLRRAFSIPLAVLTTAAGAGPFLDGGSFQSPLFDTFRDLAPLTVWGVAWLVTTVFVVIASVTGRWWSYVIAHLMAGFMSTFWLLVLLKARVGDGLAVSPTAFGLWAFPVAYCAVALFIPIAAAPSKRVVQRQPFRQ